MGDKNSRSGHSTARIGDSIVGDLEAEEDDSTSANARLVRGVLRHHQSVYITATIKNSEERHRIRPDMESEGHPTLETDYPQARK